MTDSKLAEIPKEAAASIFHITIQGGQQNFTNGQSQISNPVQFDLRGNLDTLKSKLAELGVRASNLQTLEKAIEEGREQPEGIRLVQR